MPHATVPSPGLQAIILCGPGESLSTFTSNPKDFSKALVPIANRPMVWYPLDWCYRMGINDITLVTPPESQQGLESALATNPALTSLPSPKPELIAPAELTQTTGTGVILSLPEVQKAIRSDFVILPCDLISELDGTRLIQQWMTLNPISISPRGTKRRGGLALYYPTQGFENISHKDDETDFIATIPLETSTVAPPPGSLRPNIERLAIAMPTDTLTDKIDDGKGFFQLRSQLSGKYGRVKMRTKHRDAHVYIFPKWVKEYAASNPKFDSISEDVLGWWAKSQWQTGLGEKLIMDEALGQTADSSEDMESSQLEEPLADAASMSTTKALPTPASSTHFASRVGGSAVPAPIDSLAVPTLLAYVQPTPTTASPQPLIRRVDNFHTLLNVSLFLAKQHSHQLGHEHKIHPTAILAQQARVSQEDSLIAENVKIGFRSNIKESVVGANCDIGAGARLTRCVLMDGVTVGDGVQMVGCIIGRRARIEGMKPQEPTTPATEGGKKKGKGRKADDDDDERTKLTDCEVAPNFVVEAGTEAKGERMKPFDTGDMDDLEDEDEEDEED